MMDSGKIWNKMIQIYISYMYKHTGAIEHSNNSAIFSDLHLFTIIFGNIFFTHYFFAIPPKFFLKYNFFT